MMNDEGYKEGGGNTSASKKSVEEGIANNEPLFFFTYCFWCGSYLLLVFFGVVNYGYYYTHNNKWCTSSILFP